MTKHIALALSLVLIAVCSIFIVSPKMSSPQMHEKTIASIDEKIDTVMKLTAASTASSAAISAMPGDTATPIAEKLADFSTYFMFVLCVLYLEKYLVTITAAAAFKLLLPLALGAFVISMFRDRERWQRLSKKLALFGIALFLIVPCSIRVSDLIYETYSVSINTTIDAAEQNTTISTVESEEESGVLTWIADKAENLTNTATDILNRFIEALAVMIVTSCLIPILVLLFVVWLIKIILGIDIPVILPGKKTIALN